MSRRQPPGADELFAEAMALDASQRAAFLRERCGDDAGLLREMASLLDAAAQAGDFLAQPPLEGPVERDDEACLPPCTRLGPFRIERLIAVGGMAAVHEAARADGQFEQRVAVKVIRRDLVSRGLVRRFERERQALAALEHPNIARLLDGGATPDGRPYLVMEYVEGLPIDEFCTSRGLAMRARIELFLAVCDAVHYAHQHLFVHRDLKPANILVGRDAAPKLLDFGIAGLLRGERPESAAEVGVVLLTPRYASPEQLAGAPASTAADVYSLGVVLHELLTGRRPGDGGQSALQGLPTDLRLIVRHALADDPAARYSSVEQFRGDLQHFLGREPISIRRASHRYRLAKFAARNAVAVGLGAATMLALLAGVATSTVALRDARRAEAAARAEKQAAEQSERREARVSRFIEDMIRMANPYRRGGHLTVLDFVNDCAARAEKSFAADPQSAARIHLVLGEAYANLWKWEDARRESERAVSLAQRHCAADDPLISDCLLLLGRALTFAKEPQAVEVQREVVERRIALFGEDHPATAFARSALAFALWSSTSAPQWGPADSHYRAALATYERSPSAPDRQRGLVHFSYGSFLMNLQRPAEALEHLDAALAEWAAASQYEDYYTFRCRATRAHALRALGRRSAACDALESALRALPAQTGDEVVCREHRRLARWYESMGNATRAVELRAVAAQLDAAMAAGR